MTEPLTYAVSRPLTGALVTVSLGLLWVSNRVEQPGRLLILVAGFAAGFEACRALLLRPTLVADEEGIDVAVGLRRERVAWDEVERVTTLQPPSGGGRARRRANALEIDLGDRLLVVSGYRMGTPAAEAADALTGLKNSVG